MATVKIDPLTHVVPVLEAKHAGASENLNRSIQNHRAAAVSNYYRGLVDAYWVAIECIREQLRIEAEAQ